MKYSWSKTVFPIAAIFSFRMLGLFLLIPVFTIYAKNLQDATPVLIGFALGGYGLTQGLLQIPFGMLSDRFGRKPVISVGLILFIGGSLLGAVTHSIQGIIFARIVQGSGAIGSVLIALLADLTPDQQRTKAMAVIGMTIGISFSLAMVISPAVASHFGLAGIFYITSILGAIGLGLLLFIIPNPQKDCFHIRSELNLTLFKSILKNPDLLRINFSIFCQHFVLTSTFFVIPLLLAQQVRQGYLSEYWYFYLPLMLGSFILMSPFLLFGEKSNRMKSLLVLAILLSSLTQGLLVFLNENWYAFCALVFLYFVAFNILEASLPSMVSRQADPNSKGTAMGVYSTCQFLGIFAGGSLAGILYQSFNAQGIFITNALICLVWWAVSCFMQPNNYFSSLVIPCVAPMKNQATLVSNLLQLAGVKEAFYSDDEKALHVRVHKESYRPGSVEVMVDHLTRNGV